MGKLLRYWYLQSLGQAYHSFLGALGFFESQLALRATLQNLTKPIFQDYTFQGRIVGVGLRLARLFLGLLIYLVIALLYIASYLLWLAFPILCLVSLLGSFLGANV